MNGVESFLTNAPWFTAGFFLLLAGVFALAAWWERRAELRIEQQRHEEATGGLRSDTKDFIGGNGNTRLSVALARQLNEAAALHGPASRTKENPLVTRQ